MANPPTAPKPAPAPTPTPTPAPAPAPAPTPPGKAPTGAATPAASGPPTNGKKAIITASLWPPDWQLAESSGAKLPYFAKGEAGETLMDDNHIETWKAIPTQTCTHTYVRMFLVVHDKTLIGNSEGNRPSWYASNGEKLGAPPHGVGVKGKKVQFYAQAVGKSKDVKVEGNWVVREDDKTKQDNDNGPGKFVYAKGRTEVPDDSDLIFMQCSVSKLRLECKHPEPTSEEAAAAAEAKKLGVTPKEPPKEKRTISIDPADPKSQNVFEVFVGDAVTIWATRINAAETDPAKQKKPFCDFKLYKDKRKPPPEETKHAAFLLSRNKGIGIPFVSEGWDLKENVTLVGTDEADKDGWTATKIVIGKEWLTDSPEYLMKAGKPEGATGATGAMAAADKTRAATELVDARMAAGDAVDRKRTNQSAGAASEVVSATQRVDRAKESYDASRKTVQGVKDVETVGKSVYTLFKTYQAVMSFINWDPVTVTLKASGCSKGPTAIVKAYPKGAAEVDLWALKDLPFKKTVETVKSAVDAFKQFLKYIKGARIKGRGTPDEMGAPDDAATVQLGGVTIGFYFFRRQAKVSNSQYVAKAGLDTKAREDDDMDPVLKLSAEWKELDKDVPAKQLGAWMVRRAFSLDIGVEKLIGLFFKADVALLKLSFIGIVAEVLDWFGVKVGPYLSFDIALSIGIVAKFGRNEYGEWFTEMGTAPVNAKCALTLFIKAGQVAEIGARVSGTWKATYVVRRNEKSQQVCLESEPGEYEVKSELYAKVDIGIWSGEYVKEFYKWTGKTSPTSWAFMEFS